ncbi:MAG: ribosome small subunit-dependent GTPase A [Candidatus Spyradocola sp.]|jgi:ribosome biogenesis GTPase
MKGRILQGIGSFYTVESEGQLYVCRARGRFRKQHITPMVGDEVLFAPPGPAEEEGFLEEILPRASALLRPPVANVDLLFVTVAAAAPQPDLLLADRLLVRARKAGIDTALVINKTDLSLETAQDIAHQYRGAGCPVILTNAESGEGVEKLLQLASGRIVAFAGQSAVGKSSLMNALCPNLSQETGSVSRIERGRHTTRKAQLVPLASGGYLADTPGFSLLELDAEDPANLKDCYPEFAPYEGLCRFDGCCHLSEPDCAVKDAAARGEIAIERLKRYAVLYGELKDKWGRRYD